MVIDPIATDDYGIFSHRIKSIGLKHRGPKEMTKKDIRFIVIDDNPFSIMYTEQVIRDAVNDAEVLTFTAPEPALRFIERDLTQDTNIRTMIFTDLHMPRIDGFAFLDRFASLGSRTKERYTVFVLSSTTDPAETSKVIAHPCASGFYQKPLTKDIVKQLIAD